MTTNAYPNLLTHISELDALVSVNINERSEESTSEVTSALFSAADRKAQLIVYRIESFSAVPLDSMAIKMIEKLMAVRRKGPEVRTRVNKAIMLLTNWIANDAEYRTHMKYG